MKLFTLARNKLAFFVFIKFIAFNILLAQPPSKQASLNDNSPKVPFGNAYVMANCSYKIFNELNNAVGYDLYANSRLIIHQSNITAVPGNEGFKTKKDVDFGGPARHAGGEFSIAGKGYIGTRSHHDYKPQPTRDFWEYSQEDSQAARLVTLPITAVSFPKEALPLNAGKIDFYAKLIGFSGRIPVGGIGPHFFSIIEDRLEYHVGFNSNDGLGNGGLVASVGDRWRTGTGYYNAWTYEDIFGEGHVTDWHHYVFQWNKDGIPGIDNGQAKLAVFLDGKLNSTRWPTSEPEIWPSFSSCPTLNLITTENPGKVNGQVAIDEFKIFDGNNNLVLWNTLGSKQEVENSNVGLNGLFNGGGNAVFVKGISGNAVMATLTYARAKANCNPSPSVTLSIPDSIVRYTAPARIKLNATATDEDGKITKVRFYNGTGKIHTETKFPYGFLWDNVPVGNYTLTAKAFDNSGNVTTSNRIDVSVVAENVPPVVSIVSPAHDTTYTGPATIPLIAKAKDPNDKISKVEFYNGLILLRTEYIYPYTYTWTNVQTGAYTITAVATDDKGLSDTSKVVNISVSPDTIPSCLISWWPGDGNANDVKGSNNGAMYNGASFTSGKVRLAFNFDGNSYIQAPSTNLPTGNSDRTLMMWVKVDSFSPGEAFFAGYGAFGTFKSTYHLLTHDSTLVFSQWGQDVIGPQLNTNKWYHIAVSNTGNDVTLYLNGTVVGSGTIPINTPTGSPFYIGRIPGELGDIRKLDGSVDEVQIFCRALDISEIKAIVNAGCAGNCESTPPIVRFTPVNSKLIIH